MYIVIAQYISSCAISTCSFLFAKRNTSTQKCLLHSLIWNANFHWNNVVKVLSFYVLRQITQTTDKTLSSICNNKNTIYEENYSTNKKKDVELKKFQLRWKMCELQVLKKIKNKLK